MDRPQPAVTSMEGQTSHVTSDATVRACDTTSGPACDSPLAEVTVLADRCPQRWEDHKRCLVRAGEKVGCGDVDDEVHGILTGPDCLPQRSKNDSKLHGQLRSEILASNQGHRDHRDRSSLQGKSLLPTHYLYPITNASNYTTKDEVINSTTNTTASPTTITNNTKRQPDSGDAGSKPDHHACADRPISKFSDLPVCPSPFRGFYHGDHESADHPACFGSRSKIPEEVRLRINSRERQRMHDLNSALDSLRQVREEKERGLR